MSRILDLPHLNERLEDLGGGDGLHVSLVDLLVDVLDGVASTGQTESAVVDRADLLGSLGLHRRDLLDDVLVDLTEFLFSADAEELDDAGQSVRSLVLDVLDHVSGELIDQLDDVLDLVLKECIICREKRSTPAAYLDDLDEVFLLTSLSEFLHHALPLVVVEQSLLLLAADFGDGLLLKCTKLHSLFYWE